MSEARDSDDLVTRLRQGCDRARSGRCMNHSCLVRGGASSGAQTDPSRSTCQAWEDSITVANLRADRESLRVALTNALAVLGSVHEWVDQVDRAGGLTTIAGVSKAHAMHQSLKRNRPRINAVIVEPARIALGLPKETET